MRHDGHLTLIAARQFIQPFQTQLELWTPAIALLRAQSDRRRDPEYEQRVRQALSTVATQRRAFVRLAGRQSIDVGAHSLVRETQRSFERLEQQLGDIL